MGERRSEYDDGRQRGSASPDDWHKVYRGDSFDGLANPTDREDDDDDDDDE